MDYYIAKTVNLDFETAIEKTKTALQQEGFGVLTEIDIKNTLKNKLDVDFKPYTILGACNPEYAYKALQAEEMVGAMLPCNVVVQQVAVGQIKIAAVNPEASMMAIPNDNLKGLAGTVTEKLVKVIEAI